VEWRQVESKPSAGLLLLAGCLKIASATTIVAIRTPDEVVIAADSAATVQGDGRARPEPFAKSTKWMPACFLRFPIL